MPVYKTSRATGALNKMACDAMKHLVQLTKENDELWQTRVKQSEALQEAQTRADLYRLAVQVCSQGGLKLSGVDDFVASHVRKGSDPKKLAQDLLQDSFAPASVSKGQKVSSPRSPVYGTPAGSASKSSLEAMDRLMEL